MEDIKRIEQEPLASTNEIVNRALRISNDTYFDPMSPDRALVELGALHGMRELRDFYESARSKDTDLIKDMLPYMQHKAECAISKAWWETDIEDQEPPACTCKMSEVLQRINERSK